MATRAMAAVQSSNPVGTSEREIRDRLIFALDYDSVPEAERIVDVLRDSITFYKIGLRLQYADGVPELVKRLTGAGKRIFYDSKLHDIHDQTRGAVANIAKLNVDYLTVHADPEVIRAANEAKRELGVDLKIFAVTVLTSLDQADLEALGYSVSVSRLVEIRTKMAIDLGCDGVIASGLEAKAIRKQAGDKILIVTPAIRRPEDAKGDQKRVMGPKEAIQAGANHIVVGRPIREASSPRAAAESFVELIAGAL